MVAGLPSIAISILTGEPGAVTNLVNNLTNPQPN